VLAVIVNTSGIPPQFNLPMFAGATWQYVFKWKPIEKDAPLYSTAGLLAVGELRRVSDNALLLTLTTENEAIVLSNVEGQDWNVKFKLHPVQTLEALPTGKQDKLYMDVLIYDNGTPRFVLPFCRAVVQVEKSGTPPP